MSQASNLSAASVPVLPNPLNNHRHQLLERDLPSLTQEQHRAAEARAWNDLIHIKMRAKLSAHARYPRETLPRKLSNIRSMSRYRFGRKEEEELIIPRIREKVNQNREKDRLIAMELQKYYRLLQEYEHEQSQQNSKPQPRPPPQFVRTEIQTPEEFMQEIIPDIGGELLDNHIPTGQPFELPDPFEEQYRCLQSNFFDSNLSVAPIHVENDAMQDYDSTWLQPEQPVEQQHLSFDSLTGEHGYHEGHLQNQNIPYPYEVYRKHDDEEHQSY